MNAHQMISMLDVSVRALGTIGKLATVGADRAAGALTAIRVVLKSVEEGFSGSLSPQTVLSRIESLHDAVAENDAAGLAILAQRFGGGS